MKGYALIARVRAAGGDVVLDPTEPGRVVVVGSDVVDAELRAELRHHEAEVAALLAAEWAADEAEHAVRTDPVAPPMRLDADGQLRFADDW